MDSVSDLISLTFEHQLLAMNRLAAEGESALAMIGTLSLVEWFIAAAFPDLQDGPNTRLRNH
jgi:hypothetical protein